MAKDLIRKLRSCSAEERQRVALELARTGGEKGFAELIRMAEGGRRRWLGRYELADQLIAIRALAATGKEEALSYLQKLYRPVESRPVALASQRIGREEGAYFATTHERKTVDYPNARGRLRERLSYEVDTRYTVDAAKWGLIERKKVKETDTRDKAVHYTVSAALALLQQRLGATPGR